MKYLLDTHCFLWTLFDSKKLSSPMRGIISDPAQDILISAISLWEISLKVELGKLELEGVTPDQLPELAKSSGFGCLPLAPHTASSFHRLPREVHRDPFDRMLVWQAVTEKLSLVSKDKALDVYSDYGLVRCWS